MVTVHDISLIEEEEKGADWGILLQTTALKFFPGPESGIKLAGSIKSTFNPNAILDPKFRFEDLGIGGLDEELLVIFRRAFTSRLFPPEFIRGLGIQPVRGILLHGPPGTGKTLIARQIGKVLNAHEPKIVNGPEILNKYVGQSEENIRKLFHDAEAELKAKGDASQLHVIIFDEIDAICRQRGSRGDSTGVGDSVVTQLLSKLDGVDQLDNILVIGMTNRFDLIDDALLRPGRLELHLEIGLPDELGRLEILKIHTTPMKKQNRLAEDLDLAEIASLTKNFTGAELAGLVKSAASMALSRHIQVGTVAAVKEDFDEVQIGREDFLVALDDIKPAFGSVEQELSSCGIDQIINYGEDVDRILEAGASFTKLTRQDPRNNMVSVLIHGPSGSGKTALAAKIAQSSGFPFVKILSPQFLQGMSEQAKISKILKIFSDAYKSELSIIIVDNIDEIFGYNPSGPRFSLDILNTLKSAIKAKPPPKHRLLVLTTTSNRLLLDELGLRSCFKHDIYVPAITTVPALSAVLSAYLNEADVKEISAMVRHSVENLKARFSIGVQDLLALVGHAAIDEENVQKCFLSDFEPFYSYD